MRTDRSFPATTRSVLVMAGALFFLMLLRPETALSWGQGHRLIREWVVVHLPEWQRERIGAENWQRFCVDYKSLQDQHAGGKAPELDSYCKDHGLQLSLHDVNSIEKSVEGVLWYLDRITERLQANEEDEAMKFLGVLCHWNEDPGCPGAHSSPVTEAELKILIPPPPDRAHHNYLYGAGGIADIGTYEIADVPYIPQLLGRTREEAAMRIYQNQRLLERNAAARIVPLVQDVVYGDGEEAARQRAAGALDNARHIADLIHTVICLAFNRFEGGVPVPDSQRLTDWLPEPKKKRIGHPYYVTGFLVNQAMDAKRKLHPLEFSSENATQPIAHGFGTGAPFSIDFKIAPGGVFRKFTCRVGLHESAGRDGEVAFAVLVNRKEAWRSDPLTYGDEPVAISVELPAGKVVPVSLVTIPSDPAKSLSNLVVWADPMLRK